MADVPQGASKSSGDEGQLPSAVAEFPQEAEAPELIPYVISFAKYNDSLCEIALLGSNKARRALEILKAVGMKIRSEVDFQKHRIERIPVRYAGEYKKLFSGLPTDVELKEAKLQQKARIFYYDVESARKFYVVAITENHFETDKVRR